MATTNDQSPFGSLDDNESSPLHTEESLKLLAQTDPVSALKFIVSSLQNDGELTDGEPTLGYELEELAESGENTLLGITLELEDSEGGYEGGGESVQRVYALKDGEKALGFVRQTGSYYSNDGVYWDDDLSQVFPHQVTVTQYKDYP